MKHEELCDGRTPLPLIGEGHNTTEELNTSDVIKEDRSAMIPRATVLGTKCITNSEERSSFRSISDY